MLEYSGRKRAPDHTGPTSHGQHGHGVDNRDTRSHGVDKPQTTRITRIAVRGGVMRAGAETKGRIAIALAIGFCVTAMSAQRTQQARPSSESREATCRSSFRSRTTALDPRGSRVARGAARAARRPCNPLARQARTSRRHHESPAARPGQPCPTTALALGLALRGPALDGVPHGQQEGAVREALLAAARRSYTPRHPWHPLVSITSAERSAAFRSRTSNRSELWRRSFARSSRSPFLRSRMPRTLAPREGSNRWRV